MSASPTLAQLDQARRVAELLDAGYATGAIADMLGVTGPRVSQIKRRLPTLREYLGQPAPTDRLQARREELITLRRQVLAIGRLIRQDVRAIDEELSAYRIDQLLGLRR
jgi:predicted transcriptional regulator